MWIIFKRDLASLFNSPLGYSLLGSFLLLNGLLLWVFPSAWNILDAGFGDLNLFFELNPWLLIFLLPALGMKSFSEEIKLGTLELLLTKPLAKIELILGKFFAVMFLLLLGLSVSLLYLYLIKNALLPNQYIDYGVYVGSFIGLLLLAMSLAAISLWASTLVDSPFSAFLIAVFVGVFYFYGWQQLGLLFSDFYTYTLVKSISFQYHYAELNKGVLRLSNMLYFCLQTAFFLYWTYLNLEKRSR